MSSKRFNLTLAAVAVVVAVIAADVVLTWLAYPRTSPLDMFSCTPALCGGHTP